MATADGGGRAHGLALSGRPQRQVLPRRRGCRRRFEPVPGGRSALDVRRGAWRRRYGPLPRRGQAGEDHPPGPAQRRVLARPVQAHLLGSGWGARRDGNKVISAALDSELPAVVDADGLKYLPKKVPATWLLTPHAGELATLLGEERSWVTDDPVRAVRLAADRTGATVLLKGATQLVAAPDTDEIAVALPGPAWTGQAGSGDVLGGLCAALLAAGRPAMDAGVRAA